MTTRFILISGMGAIFSICLRADIGLLIGIAISLSFSKVSKERILFWNKKLLAASVVGLGFGMKIEEVATAGTLSIHLSIATIIGTIIVGGVLGRLLSIPFQLHYLISCGTAICGGSAIAAISKAIGAKNEDIALSLVCVFILNAAAIFIFPFLGHAFNLNPVQFGVWCALAIHDTSSVLAAASQFSEESLKYAIPIKLTRALCIFPLALFSCWYIRSKDLAAKTTFPWFIVYFVIASVVASFIPGGQNLWEFLYFVSKKSLILSIFLIGLSFSIKSFENIGWIVISYAITLWLCVASITLIAIRYTPL